MASVAFNTCDFAYYADANATKPSADWNAGGTWSSYDLYVGSNRCGNLISVNVTGTSDTITQIKVVLPMSTNNAGTYSISGYLYDTYSSNLKPKSNYSTVDGSYIKKVTVSASLKAYVQTVTFTFSGLSITGKNQLYLKFSTTNQYKCQILTKSAKSSASISCTTGSSGGGGTTTTYYAYLQYNLQGGSWSRQNYDEYSSSSSSTFNKKVTSTKPTREGYTFKGWATSSTSTTVAYAAGASITLQGATGNGITKNLYAVWEKNTVYTYCCYDLTNKQRIGSEINTSSASITCPSKTGYKYEGYVYHQDYASCISYQQSTGYDSTGTTCSQHKSSLPYVVFFYTKIPTTYTVQCYDYKYNSSGEQLGVQLNSETKTYAAGSTVYGSAWGEDSPWIGYEYGGCTSISVSSSKRTVERHFSPKFYTVSYNLNGVSGTTPSNTSRRYNESYTLTSTTPTNTKYTFIGWNTNPSATTGVPSETIVTDTSSITKADNITYYAIWEIKTYTVTINYNLNGGIDGPSSWSQTANVGTNITTTISSTKPTKDRYKFINWSKGNSATTYNSGQSISFSSATTLNLYAVWENKFGADNIYYGVNGEWKLVETYYGVNGQWVPLKIYYGNDNKWKNNT